MTWTAPEATRAHAPAVADERATLQGELDCQRQTLLAKCAGLTREQLVERAAPPSSLTLLGLVRHLADVERWWFRTHLAGEGVDGRFGPDDNPSGDFDDVDAADPAADLTAFVEEVGAADASAAPFSLDHTFPNPWRPGQLSVRWLYLHMIAEYARHCGHADILRERIDGAAGL